MKEIMRFRVDLNNLPELTEEEKKEIFLLSKESDDDIDYSDIPELTEEELKRFRPLNLFKKRTVVNIDSDVLSWLMKRSNDYKMEINRILRNEMLKNLVHV